MERHIIPRASSPSKTNGSTALDARRPIPAQRADEREPGGLEAGQSPGGQLGGGAGELSPANHPGLRLLGQGSGIE